MQTVQSPRSLLFSLALIAGGWVGIPAVSAQVDAEEPMGFSVGSHVGGLLPLTELTDEVNVRGAVYVRRGLLPHWQVELNGGYERLTSSDSGTDVGTLSGRLLFHPIVRRHWNLYLSGGVGLLRYDWDQPDISALRTPGLDGIGSVPMIPLSAGIQYVVSDHLALEASLGYTMAFSDALNAVEEGGNDAFFRGTIGLTLGRFGDQPARRSAPAVSVAQRDTDEDEGAVPPLQTDPDTAATDDEERSRVADLDLVEEEVSAEPSMEGAKPLAQRIVLFDLNATALSAETEQILDGVLQDLRERPEVVVVLRGHTDSWGSVWYNTKLGMKRARAVKEYLLSKGIDAGRLRLESKGEREPVRPNATAAGRQLNRRVEMILPGP